MRAETCDDTGAEYIMVTMSPLSLCVSVCSLSSSGLYNDQLAVLCMCEWAVVELARLVNIFMNLFLLITIETLKCQDCVSADYML